LEEKLFLLGTGEILYWTSLCRNLIRDCRAALAAAVTSGLWLKPKLSFPHF
jgi:hypothetical protein